MVISFLEVMTKIKSSLGKTECVSSHSNCLSEKGTTPKSTDFFEQIVDPEI